MRPTWIAALIMALAAAPAHAAGVALVLGNGTYANFPQLGACPQSAHTVAAALRRAGFAVTEQEDGSSGAMDAALGGFAAALAAVPGQPAVIYACAYATGFSGRPFLLPVSAALDRPGDVLTQGVLARTLTDVLRRAASGPALVALDVVPARGTPAALGLGSLAQDLPPHAGLIAVTETKPAAAPTPLATGLAAALAAPTVQTGPTLTTLQARIAAAGPVAQVAALALPSQPGALIQPPVPHAPIASAPAASAPAAAAPVASAPAAPPPSLPAEADMTDQQRRAVQIALAQLGYYDGRIDGAFGPGTRAAIRRYQHELHADMTGTLTPAQATRLVRAAQ